MVKNPQKTALFNLTTYFYKESLMANISFGGEIGPSRPQNYGHAFLWRKSATSNFRDFFQTHTHLKGVVTFIKICVLFIT